VAGQTVHAEVAGRSITNLVEQRCHPRLATQWFLYLAVVTLVTGCSVAPGDSTAGHPSPVAWSWKLQARYVGAVGLSSVSCSTPETCWVVGQSGLRALIMATTDAGRTWVAETAPPGIGPLTDVSCPTRSECWAVARTSRSSILITTSDGGLTWTKASLPRGTSVADVDQALSCPAAGVCWAVLAKSTTTSTVYATVNGGRSWHPSGPSAQLEPAGLACPTVRTCWMIGEGYGPSVTPRPEPGSGQEVWVTTDSGDTWRSKTSGLPVGEPPRVP
jgi:hypothetical protein